ncbi:MAG: ribbon-helix-helix protein, CopG family [Nitrospinae bacterium]|nr:ribbon-helix-helix protein, CopG family [Nitrospinota bacterium]
MVRITKIVGFSVSPALAKEVERVARREGRTKSELFREMFRVYQRYRKQQERGEERWVTELIREAKGEQQRDPMTEEEMLKEEEELGRYGAEQARKLGIQTKDINRIIDASRKRWRS